MLKPELLRCVAAAAAAERRRAARRAPAAAARPGPRPLPPPHSPPRSIVDFGFEHPSEVQHEAIPNCLLGMDVLCQAKSGMGKTASHLKRNARARSSAAARHTFFFLLHASAANLTANGMRGGGAMLCLQI